MKKYNDSPRAQARWAMSEPSTRYDIVERLKNTLTQAQKKGYEILKGEPLTNQNQAVAGQFY